MQRVLNVWWADDLVGTLSSNDGQALVFRYVSTARRAISRSLPLPKADAAEDLDGSFFENLLPDGREREALARAIGVSIDNTMSLLEKIGGDCAGALSVLPTRESPMSRPDVPPVPITDRWLIEARALGVVATLVQENLRLSLAGAQQKLAVLVDNHRLMLPEGKAPSTHILKLPSTDYRGVVENELYVMTLARDVGLSVPNVSTWPLPGGDLALLVERFDRQNGHRLHQEDFCQATGRPPSMKYEIEGGPELKEIVEILRDESAAPADDIESVIRWLVFNTLIGNNDAHGKNIALIREPVVRLAPFYDLLCTRAWPNLNADLAMRVGDMKQAGALSPTAWALEAERCGVGVGAVRDIIGDMHGRVVEAAKRIAAQLIDGGTQATPVRNALEQIEEHCRWAARNLRQPGDWRPPKPRRGRRRQ